MSPHFTFSRWQQIAATGVLSALLAPSLFSQTSSQAPTPKPAKQNTQGLFRLSVNADLVLVNVVVRDKKGALVTGLGQNDFTVLEDGKPQQITSFDYENIETAPLLSAGDAGPARRSMAGAPAIIEKPILTRDDARDALKNHRLIMLFFDLSSM